MDRSFNINIANLLIFSCLTLFVSSQIPPFIKLRQILTYIFFSSFQSSLLTFKFFHLEWAFGHGVSKNPISFVSLWINSFSAFPGLSVKNQSAIDAWVSHWAPLWDWPVSLSPSFSHHLGTIALWSPFLERFDSPPCLVSRYISAALTLCSTTEASGETSSPALGHR